MDNHTQRKLAVLRLSLADENEPKKAEALRREIALAEALIRTYARIDMRK